MTQKALECRGVELEKRLGEHLKERELLVECAQAVHAALSKLLQSVPTDTGG